LTGRTWGRRAAADLPVYAPAAVPPPPQAVPAAAPEVRGYLAVISRNGTLSPVGSVGTLGTALREARWWTENDAHPAFVVELREVPG
jgi:hypothetical protein